MKALCDLQTDAGRVRKVQGVNTATLGDTHDVVYVSSSSPHTVTLPTTPAGRVYTVVRYDASAFNSDVTIAPGVGGKINGSTASVVLYVASDYVTLVALGANDWAIVADGRVPHTCIVTKSAAQTLANNVAGGTALTFDTETEDNAGLHDNATNNSRITVKRAGIYQMTVNVEWTASATGNRQVLVKKNGASFLDNGTVSAGLTIAHGVSLPRLVKLAAGDYLEVFGFQTSGGSLDVRVATTFALSEVR